MSYSYIDYSDPNVNNKAKNEYDKLKDLVTKPGQNDVYNDLINKEIRVLDTINNLINVEEKKKNKKKIMYNLTLKEILINLLKVIVDIINDISTILLDPLNKNRDLITVLKKVRKTFTKKDRLVYVGLFFIIISLLIYFIDGTS